MSVYGGNVPPNAPNIVRVSRAAEWHMFDNTLGPLSREAVRAAPENMALTDDPENIALFYEAGDAQLAEALSRIGERRRKQMQDEADFLLETGLVFEPTKVSESSGILTGEAFDRAVMDCTRCKESQQMGEAPFCKSHNAMARLLPRGQTTDTSK